MYCGNPHALLLGAMLPTRKNQKRLNYHVDVNGSTDNDLMIQIEKGGLVTVRLYLMSPATSKQRSVSTPRPVSRKEVEEHIKDNANHLSHLQLDVFTDYTDFENPVIRIEGLGGLVKIFKTTQAAKSWITRENNKALAAQVDKDYAMSQPLESKLDYIRYAY
jgi:hypothetical protein